MPHHALLALLLALGFSLVVSCPAVVDPTAVSAGERRVSLGLWGADGIVLTVAADGATTDFACAHGAILEPLVLDAHGQFDVRGTHTSERAGPSREDDPPRDREARYTGHVDGQRLVLTVAVIDPPETIGTYTLRQGATPRIVKCQ